MSMKEWVASYSGCDGGSPSKSIIWFVGIEWGFAKKKGQSDLEHDKSVSEYHNGGMQNSINSGFSSPHESTYPLKEHTNYTFGLNSTKLISAIMGNKVEQYPKFVESSKDTDVFKLNLYPIGLPTTDDSLWGKFKLADITGLSTKQEYREYCASYRFPFFRAELEKHKPTIILTTGSSLVEQFEKCFCGDDKKSQLNTEAITDISSTNSKPRYLYWRWLNEETLFVNVPFMTNASGLNSHNLLQKFGDRIREIQLENNKPSQ